MEKDNKTQGTKRLGVSKLKNRNAKMLKEIMIKGTVELQEEILGMYEKMKEVGYEKDISKVEKKEIEDFLSKKIIKIEEVKEEKIDKYVEKYKEIKKLIEKQYYIEVAGLKVMKNNLRVNSEGWKEKEVTGVLKGKEQKIKVKYHENEKGEEDIWEYLEGEFAGEQLFTRDAAVRETERMGVKPLEFKQWEEIIKECGGKTTKEESKNTIDKLGIKYCGYRIFYGSKFCDIGNASNYWLPSGGFKSCNIWFGDSKWGNNRRKNSFGFSVRCVVQD